MGDRVSIQFVNKEAREEETPILCHHWGGKWFPKLAFEYAKNLQKVMAESLKEGGINDPLHRLEPRVVLVHFLQTMSQEKGFEYTDSLYLATSVNHVDNSDNGHYTIHLDMKKPIKMTHDVGEFEASA
jgi:hypothetical protein